MYNCAKLKHMYMDHIGNHIIEFEDPDSAVGVVYSKNEHETFIGPIKIPVDVDVKIDVRFVLVDPAARSKASTQDRFQK